MRVRCLCGRRASLDTTDAAHRSLLPEDGLRGSAAGDASCSGPQRASRDAQNGIARAPG